MQFLFNINGRIAFTMQKTNTFLHKTSMKGVCSGETRKWRKTAQTRPVNSRLYSLGEILYFSLKTLEK